MMMEKEGRKKYCWFQKHSHLQVNGEEEMYWKRIMEQEEWVWLQPVSHTACK